MFHPKGPTFLELARQGLSSTRRGYDLLAPKFDYTPFRTPDDVLDVVADALGPLGPFPRVLDLCCGTGAGLRSLRPLCTELLVGVDFSHGMLAEARRQLAPGSAPPEAPPRIELVRADVLDLGWNGAFDLVTCFGALGHIPRNEERRFVASVHRTLQPGGRFAFLTTPMPSVLSGAWWLSRGYNAVAHLRNLLIDPPFVMFYLTFTLEAATRLLEDAGFEVTTASVRFPKPWQSAVLVIARRA